MEETIVQGSGPYKVVFACGGTLVDSRDGKTYATVQIGDQCWMADNLRYTTSTCLSADWNTSAPLNACREHSTSWGTEVLYQWGAAMNGSITPGDQGLCPVGWYIPTHDDITTLERYVCNAAGNSNCATNFPFDTTTTGWRGTNEGDRLKSSNPYWCNNATGCASSEFNKKPAGSRNSSGSLSFVGSFGYWWSSSPSGSNAWRRFLSSGYSDVNRWTGSQAYGYSVRCLLGQ